MKTEINYTSMDEFVKSLIEEAKKRQQILTPKSK